jgi:3'(2'), 5'-bisphosphate nucleotidase
MKLDIPALAALAVQGGKAILSVYADTELFSSVTLKEDDSPLTIADQQSHHIIAQGLADLYPHIPLLSEEGLAIPYEERRSWEYYWCVDPLDGTKEFIGRNGEFTVNIALIHRDTPIFGLIYVPVQDLLYYGDRTGSFKQVPGQSAVPIQVDRHAREWIALGSRSHADASESGYLDSFPVSSIKSAGSSLKFCLIAEGTAHIYYRKGPTMEWDTAAGHAIAKFSGAIFTTPEGEPFVYNKRSLTNGSFVCRIPNQQLHSL